MEVTVSQDKATKTDKAQDGIIGKIVKAIQTIGDHRTALGKLMRDARAAGLSLTAIVQRVTAALPQDPSLYLGMKLTPNGVRTLIARADAIDRNGKGFIHGTNIVTLDDIGLLKLNTQQEADLVVALDNGINSDTGVSVASVRRAVETVRRNGADSESGERAIQKVLDNVAHFQRYQGASEGSVLEAERMVAESERRYLSAQKSLAKAKKAWDEAKALLEERRREESLAIAEKAAAPAEAPAPRKGEGKGRRRGSGKGKVQPIQAAAAQ